MKKLEEMNLIEWEEIYPVYTGRKTFDEHIHERIMPFADKIEEEIDYILVVKDTILTKDYYWETFFIPIKYKGK